MTGTGGFRGARAAVLMLSFGLATGLLSGVPARAAEVPGTSVYLEELTHTELSARMRAGVDTVLIPIGGTEQSGPAVVLGKHNVRAHLLAGRIAHALGYAVVAPVIAYVPEGAIHPPQGHMRFAGTISIPDSAFEGMLEGAARSFHEHGFKHVVFLGDHGGYQRNDERVADKLNREWKVTAGGPAVLALTAYYRAYEDFDAQLRRQGYSNAEIGVHAGLADTALAMAADPSTVRVGELKAAGVAGVSAGVRGDPTRATAALGQPGLDHVVEVSTAALRKAYGH
jgi:creatinine amidohydrolase